MSRSLAETITEQVRRLRGRGEDANQGGQATSSATPAENNIELYNLNVPTVAVNDVYINDLGVYDEAHPTGPVDESESEVYSSVAITDNFRTASFHAAQSEEEEMYAVTNDGPVYEINQVVEWPCYQNSTAIADAERERNTTC